MRPAVDGSEETSKQRRQLLAHAVALSIAHQQVLRFSDVGVYTEVQVFAVLVV